MCPFSQKKCIKSECKLWTKAEVRNDLPGILRFDEGCAITLLAQKGEGDYIHDRETFIRENKDFESGMIAAIQAGKTGPALGWTCLSKYKNNPKTLFGKIVCIDFENKIVEVYIDTPIVTEKDG